MPERLAARADEIMSTDVLTVGSDTPVTEVVQLLADENASCVVVVNDDGKPTGIVSERDLLVLAKTGEQRLAGMLSRLLQEEHHTFDALRQIRKSAALGVADIASTPAQCADAAMTVGQVAALMDKFDYRQLPVVRDGKVVGIVTRQEVVKAIAGEA
ncbi:MAG: CBS domain-containing protein [Dehalococcoidia bacterium]